MTLIERLSAKPRRDAAFLLLAPATRPDMLLSTSNAAIEYTTDLSRIDFDCVYDWIARKSYWAGQMPRRVFDRAVGGSLCFAAVEGGATVGFCRVITDRATFAYIADVFVDPEHRGRGIGQGLMRAVSAHPDLQDLRRWLLVTADAHGLYAHHGFEALATPERFMERRDPDVYQRLGAQPGVPA
jgi:GNAT superfamily N-acetyltransferase